MPYARLKQAVRVAAQREAEKEAADERQRWRRTAFLAYQFGAPYRRPPISFDQYLKQQGMAGALSDTAEVPMEDLAAVKERAMATGERIRAMDQARC